MQKFFDVAMKILAVLVIPILAWGIKLEVNLAVLRSELDRAKVDVAEALDIKEAVNENKVTLGRMDSTLVSLNTAVGEIKGLINK